MLPLDLVKLTALMKRASGNPIVKIGFIDGPVLLGHSELTNSSFHELPGKSAAACKITGSAACLHGTFVAGILSARRDSSAPAICPGCTLLVRPVFAETVPGNAGMPAATPDELASAVLECIAAGANVINLSLGLARPSTKGEKALEEAFNYAARRNVIIVAAAGNQGSVGSSAITRHPWVIPVIACDLRGRPIDMSNLGNSIGRYGLSAPGHNITSLGGNAPLTLSGTSIAAPFVTGAIALLMSEFPGRLAADIKLAITRPLPSRRANLVPPLLDAEASYWALAAMKSRRVGV